MAKKKIVSMNEHFKPLFELERPNPFDKKRARRIKDLNFFRVFSKLSKKMENYLKLVETKPEKYGVEVDFAHNIDPKLFLRFAALNGHERFTTALINETNLVNDQKQTKEAADIINKLGINDDYRDKMIAILQNRVSEVRKNR